MSGTFGVNSETLFALALVSNHPQRKEAVAQSQERQQGQWHHNLTDPEIVVRRIFNEALSPLMQDCVYGPLYKHLVLSHVDRIDFSVLDWALRGQYGIYLKQVPEEVEAEKGFSNQETALFWKAVVESEQLLQHLRILSSNWGGNSQQGGCRLRSHFQSHSAALSQPHEGSFLIQTFLGMSLERINWDVVCRMLNFQIGKDTMACKKI